MIVETCQMLANCFPVEQLYDAPRTAAGNIRKHSYYFHPCSVWVRASMEHYSWLTIYGYAMCKEKEYRGGNPHFCREFISWCLEMYPPLPQVGFSPPPFAFKHYDDLKNPNDPVGSYRRYYVADKATDKNGKSMLKYTNRPVPEFWSCP